MRARETSLCQHNGSVNDRFLPLVQSATDGSFDCYIISTRMAGIYAHCRELKITSTCTMKQDKFIDCNTLIYCWQFEREMRSPLDKICSFGCARDDYLSLYIARESSSLRRVGALLESSVAALELSAGISISTFFITCDISACLSALLDISRESR